MLRVAHQVLNQTQIMAKYPRKEDSLMEQLWSQVLTSQLRLAVWETMSTRVRYKVLLLSAVLSVLSSLLIMLKAYLSFTII